MHPEHFQVTQMRHSKCESLPDDEAAILTEDLDRLGEVYLARTIGLARQTLSRAANRRPLYSRPRAKIQSYLRSRRRP
jgi:hypothetical protein